MKAIKTTIMVMAFLLLSSISAWAGSWVQADTGAYQYKNDDGTCLINTWLQDNGKWYFLGEGGWMAANSVIEGYQLGVDGAETTGVATIVSQFPQVILQTALQPAAKTTAQTSAGADAQLPTKSATNQTQAPAEKTISYVLNKSTKKFHKPSCSSVSDMAAKNRLDSTDSRETIAGKGYEACKRCKP